jgi:ribosomal protein S18 acetylase RimI-like enzyme
MGDSRFTGREDFGPDVRINLACSFIPRSSPPAGRYLNAAAGRFVPCSGAEETGTVRPNSAVAPGEDSVSFSIRAAGAGDEAGAYYVCLKTGDHGQDAAAFYVDDPDALGRIYVGPYLAFEPRLALILEREDATVAGYALGALDSRAFYRRYETEWRPQLCARFPEPAGGSATWTRTQHAHHAYHHPDYTCPDPYDEYPSHMHIDLLPEAQGRGFGRRMLEEVMRRLREFGSPGVHLGVSGHNHAALGFYHRLGFFEISRAGDSSDPVVYLGKRLRD